MRQPKIRANIALGLRVLLLLPVSNLAEAAVPRSMVELRQIVADAVENGKQRVIIPPGIYRGTPASGEKVHWTLKRTHDLEIVAVGVTMVCMKRTRAIDFVGCRNVTLQGLTIDYEPLTFTQGRVVATAPDDVWIDIKLDPGYPCQPWSRIDVVDPATYFRKKGMPFLWGTTAEMVESNVVRVKLKGIGKAARVGDLVSLSAGNEEGGICHGVTLSDCRGEMVLRDLTIHCAPGMGIVESGGEGGTVLEGIRIVPGPPPAGASTRRLLTTSWDGILHTNVGRGPRVEHCTIEKCGDDSWSVQNQDILVVRRAGRELILAPRGETQLAPNDFLCRSLDAPQYELTDVCAVERAKLALDPDVAKQLQEAKPWTLWKVSGRFFLATVTGEPGLQSGDSVFCPQRQGNGFIFRNNRIHSPGRILIKAGEGLVEGNTLVMPHGLVICPEVPDGAAAGIRNLVIRGNTITESGYFCESWDSDQAGAISIVASAVENEKKTFRPPGAFADVTIEANRFEGVCGLNLLLSSVRGARVRNNCFIRTHQSEPGITAGAYGIEQRAIVAVRHCTDVSFEDNVFEDIGRFAKESFQIDAESADVRGVETRGL